MNIEIMRAFVQLRRMLGANEELARKLDALEQKYDGQFSGRVSGHPRTDDAFSSTTANDRL